MDGAVGIDLSSLNGRTMINLDSEDEGVFTVSCAGGARATMDLPISRRAVYGPCVKVVIEGLCGGHSGVEIHKNRANANKMMGELLSRIQELMPFSLTKLEGGAKDNAIAHTAQATFVALGMNAERINDVIALCACDFKIIQISFTFWQKAPSYTRFECFGYYRIFVPLYVVCKMVFRVRI